MSHLLLLMLVACGPAAVSVPEVESTPTYQGSLLALAPAESRYVVLARPETLYQSQAFRTVADPLFSQERLQAFADHTGVDLRRVPEALYAQLGEGRFVIAARVPSARDVVVAAGMRMNTVEVSVDEPFVRRVGFLGLVRREVVAVGDDLLILGAGSGPQIAELLDGIRNSELPVHALRSEDGAILVAATGAAPLVLHGPHPLGLPASSGIGLVLVRERAGSIAVTPTGDVLEVLVTFLGELPPGGLDNLRHFLTSLGQSDMGAALGINQVGAAFDLQVIGERTELRFQWPVRTLARGLRVLFTDELDQLLEEPVFAE